MEPIVFMRDGVLRRRFSAYDHETKSRVARLVPLVAWERGVDQDAFLKSLHSSITFEDGLTVVEMMENLAPWASVMIGVACMDFPAFLEEARRGGGGCEEVSHILLSYDLTIEAVPKYERISKRESAGADKNVFSMLGMGAPIRTDRVRTEGGWIHAAMLSEEGRKGYEGEESVSLSLTPVSEYAHVPLVIAKSGRLMDQTPFGDRFLGTDLPILNPEHPLVRRGTPSQSGVILSDLPIDAPYPTFFDTLVRGFLWDMGFDYSPVQRDRTAEKVRSSVERLKIKLGEDGEPAPQAEPPEPVADEVPEPEERDEFRREMEMLSAAERAAQDLGLILRDVPAPD